MTCTQEDNVNVETVPPKFVSAGNWLACSCTDPTHLMKTGADTQRYYCGIRGFAWNTTFNMECEPPPQCDPTPIGGTITGSSHDFLSQFTNLSSIGFEGGTITYSDGSDGTVNVNAGITATVACNAGFTRTGNEVYECLTTSAWDLTYDS